MSNMTQIRQAMAAALGVIPNTQVSAYMLANPTPPTIHLYPGLVDYDQVMHRAMDQLTFTVQAMVGQTTDQGSQVTLDAMLAPSGSTSVKAALEVSKTLGGVVQDIRVVSASGYRIYQPSAAQPPVLGCEWTVLVLT